MNDPLAEVRALLATATARETGDPTRMALATADARGCPSVRVVLLKAVDAEGFTFFTNLGSRKARELDANPRAALVIHWEALGVQVRAEGPVDRVAAPESDAYFATRPRGSQLGAWASRQSEPIATRADLLVRLGEVEARFAGQDVPRPPFWGGLRLCPLHVEIWRAEESRLHQRILYTREPDGTWSDQILQP